MSRYTSLVYTLLLLLVIGSLPQAASAREEAFERLDLYIDISGSLDDSAFHAATMAIADELIRQASMLGVRTVSVRYFSDFASIHVSTIEIAHIPVITPEGLNRLAREHRFPAGVSGMLMRDSLKDSIAQATTSHLSRLATFIRRARQIEAPCSAIGELLATVLPGEGTGTVSMLITDLQTSCAADSFLNAERRVGPTVIWYVPSHWQCQHQDSAFADYQRSKQWVESRFLGSVVLSASAIRDDWMSILSGLGSTGSLIRFER